MRNHHRYKQADEDDQVLALNNYAEGYLVKQGARVKNWKRRYFVFRDGYLSYRKDQRETSKVLGTDLVVDVFYWSGAEFGLELKLSSGRSMYVSPASEQQAGIWYEVVQGYVMRQQMVRQLQHVNRQNQKHLEPIWECDSAAQQSAELAQYRLLR
ncbi:hypothetical protein PHYSODRAFT_333939 [Phytophthora sojae]|uniref:PH domain-containing protein n=1 Tax=Phytophthora sojae (strain P6497) TaxID=1094619 RepID=G4ZNB7_PHYSP|nr:hypothetical protein PHYSODRAFT_333939 [Phytophthora sojae]EGZ15727.1 hypothetical protein PHYSODRAFT_333939 [Phytophthora sojae]|eukprot:XP_009529476.1 hypothetical protein PHYSODRAFT_333939 [Phytophthora sojae]